MREEKKRGVDQKTARKEKREGEKKTARKAKRGEKGKLDLGVVLSVQPLPHRPHFHNPIRLSIILIEFLDLRKEDGRERGGGGGGGGGRGRGRVGVFIRVFVESLLA